MPSEVDEIQRRLASDVLGQGMKIAAQQELLTPFLALVTEDGRTLRYAIKTPDVEPHVVTKVLLAANRATHAAVCFEGWGYEEARPEGVDADEWRRMAVTGRRPASAGPFVLPRDHPDRFDMLVLLTQARDTPAAPHLHRQWRIAPGSPRTFHEQDLTGGHQAPSNFWPMFVRYGEIRGLIRMYAELARLVDEVRHGRG